MRKIRWGILGTGNIASQFARGLRNAPRSELVAAGSRSPEKARAFGLEWGIPRCHGTYADLVGDPDLDVVYIATPHSLHLDNMMLCLHAGKAVLCEKPLAINEAQARQAMAVAKRSGLFLMEAMWTRFLPSFVQLRRVLAEGVIGEVRAVSADLGFAMKWDPTHRLFDLRLGGGCLLDVGIYPVSLATMILGRPEAVSGEACIGQTGVDEQEAIAMRFGDGQIASLHASLRTQTQQQATIAGSAGQIQIASHWWKGGPLLVMTGGTQREIDPPVEGNGYQYEAMEVEQCLLDGKVQSEVMPWEESLTVLRTMDQLRALWGLKYPME